MDKWLECITERRKEGKRGRQKGRKEGRKGGKEGGEEGKKGLKGRRYHSSFLHWMLSPSRG